MRFIVVFVGYFEERRSIILGICFIEVHIPAVILLGRAAYLMMISYSGHRIEMSGIAKIGVVEFFENVLAGAPKQSFRDDLLLLGLLFRRAILGMF